ncbi:MAG TPA: carbon monoxide dehydrogenase, partial [Deltaproteobacteria bacterium]|nr:carbon monoxide dehydrogenase [Deltaproteobacteria bacterium]
EKVVMVNRVKNGQEESIRNILDEYGLKMVGMVPEDPQVAEFDLEGKPTIELEKESRAMEAAYAIFDKIFQDR